MRWLRIAIGFTVTLLTLLCMLPAQAAQGSGWAVLLDEQGDLQLSDIRSSRYTNQFSPIELERLTAAAPEGALWLRFRLAPGKHEQLLRVFAPDLSHLNLYVLDGDQLIDQLNTGGGQLQATRPLPSSDFMLPLPQSDKNPRRLLAAGLRTPVAALHHPAIGGHDRGYSEPDADLRAALWLHRNADPA